MKCKSCGANLEIDTAFCPYCGKANPVAKKHREDMAHFEKDYKDTKKAVISSSKKFNRKTFYITMVAVTVAFIAVLCVLMVNTHRIGYNRYISRARAESMNYLPDVKRLVKECDYLELSRLVEGKPVKFSYSNDELEPYNYPAYAAQNYSDLFIYLMRVNGGSTYGSGMAGNIAASVGYIFKYADKASEINDPDIVTYAQSIKRDTVLLLEEYIGVPKETAESLLTCSEATRNLAIEEALNAYTAEK